MLKAKFTADDGRGDIVVHFNPSEYSITTDESAAEDGELRLSSTRNERLSVQLVFDTYTLPASAWGMVPIPQEREDVRVYTDRVAGLAVRNSDGKKPLVTFSWGSLNFKGIVVSVSQRFTMFMDDGKPVRATLDVVMRSTGNETEKAGGGSVNWMDNKWKDTMQTPNPRELLDMSVL